MRFCDAKVEVLGGLSANRKQSVFIRHVARWRRGNSGKNRRSLFPISFGLNLLRMPGEHALRRDVADGAVQTDVVVMIYGKVRWYEFWLE